MSYITYKQADSRWGKKNYNGSSSMATAGCGPTSVAMLAYAVDGKTTPWDVAKYMQKHGYAIRNNGTAWAGIPAAMKAFGLTDVKNVAKMSDIFTYLKHGYCAVFLFKAGTKGGITWTTSGHYVAVTNYKENNGKHYLYTRDSGGRNHTGWYCYETQMRGLIPQVWVGKATPKKKTAPIKPTKLPTLPERGYFKKGDKGATTVQQILIYLGFSCGSAGADGIYGSDTANAVIAFQKKYGLKPDYEWGKQCNRKAADLLGITITKDIKCIDVSEHQGVIDWKKVKASGIEYAVIRAGYGKGNEDKHFVRNITEALRAGIHVSVYWFMYSYTTAMAKAEAEYCMKLIAPWKDAIAVVFADWEYDSMNYAKKNKVSPSKNLITAMNKEFCEAVKKSGYTAGVYYNYDYKANHMKLSELPYVNWYALGKSNGKYTSVAIQQYGTESVNGITGKVDMNWIHKTDVFMAKKKPAVVQKTKGQIIAEKAKECAWAYGTPKSKYTYPSGSATAGFKKAIEKAYPKRSTWGKQTRAGASCDVFVGTVVRASGVDTSFPRGLDGVEKHCKNNPKWQALAIKDTSKLQAGDVVFYLYKGGGHIYIYLGNGYVANAHYNGKTYGIVQKISDMRSPSNTFKFIVYRAK